MAKFVSFKRIVIYQPRNGWVVDLGAGRCTAPVYNVGESYFNTGAGTRKSVSRTREMIIQVFDETSIDILRIMHKEGCEMRAIAIGEKSFIVWNIDSEINFVEQNGGVGGFSGANLIFNTDVFSGSIYQSEDLMGGVPWECETASLDTDGSTYVLPGSSGYQGDRWVVSSGDSVDEDGLATYSGNMTLTFIAPLEGARLNFTGTWAGTIKTLDWSGATLATYNKLIATTDQSVTVDDGTWKIEVQVGASASTRPVCKLLAAGSLADPRRGGCIDCSDLSVTLSTAPSWTS